MAFWLSGVSFCHGRAGWACIHSIMPANVNSDQGFLIRCYSVARYDREEVCDRVFGFGDRVYCFRGGVREVPRGLYRTRGRLFGCCCHPESAGIEAMERSIAQSSGHRCIFVACFAGLAYF